MDEWTWEVDSTRCYGRFASASKPQAAVLLVHGFQSCHVEFGGLPRRIADAGFAVLAFDLRGHGLSSGERGLIGLDRACADIDGAADALAKEVGPIPLVIVGHSLGGALAIGYAARSDRPSALIVAHPVERLMDELNPVARGAYHILGRFAMRRRRRGKSTGMLRRAPRYRLLYRSRRAARKARAEAFLQTHVNLASYPLANTMCASDWARRVRIPVLAITSRHDRNVEPAHSEAVIQSFAGPVKRMEHDGAHSCWRDQDAEAVATAVIQFLREQT